MEGSDPSAVPLLLQASLAALDAHQHRGAPYRRPPTGSEGAWLRQAPRRRGSLIESHESHRISPVKLVFVGAAPAFTTVCLTLRDTHPPKQSTPAGPARRTRGRRWTGGEGRSASGQCALRPPVIPFWAMASRDCWETGPQKAGPMPKMVGSGLAFSASRPRRRGAN